ncbi:putative membrane spanning protein [Granulibacter bethesdensis]|uniref:Membrane spanning protein n=2 Tax=Granulibacter bethesdensis TaxID=364410 RepID=Q0BQ05_GRABC|nr:putative membrane spanning protein [Granulibacter bethesdensis CGDNIH1]AHJ67933.1 putative membrane spanning protein [Granulibacter bethesdensis]APH52973.1 putative membrane spanning protein [Granulibacter bethesdensis]APH65661.1 putative membrane spanning protein [Granulibacter bethesdensis]
MVAFLSFLSQTMLMSLRLTTLDRYVMRQLLVALVACTCGLVALIWLTQSLRFIELVVNRGLSVFVFLKLTGLLIPSFVAVIIPITTYVVVQFVYQRLAGDRELTVMRAAGLSSWVMARPALLVALLTMLLSFVLNLWIVPAAFSAFREYQWEIRNKMAAFLLQDGVFTPVSDDMIVYIRKRDADGTLHGILIDDARKADSHATIIAQRGRMEQGSNGAPQVVLESGSRQELDRHTGRLNILTFNENTISLEQSGKDEQRSRDANEMSLTELLHPDPSQVMARDIPKLRVEAHRRLSGPLNVLSFAVVALVSVLNGAFRRHGGLLRPGVAALVVVALLAVGLAVANAAAKLPQLIPLIWIAAVAPGMAGAWIMFWPEWRGRTSFREAGHNRFASLPPSGAR